MITIAYRPKHGHNETMHIIPHHGWVGMTLDRPRKQLFLRCEVVTPDTPDGCGEITDLAACDIIAVDGEKAGPSAELAVSMCFTAYLQAENRRLTTERDRLVERLGDLTDEVS